MSDTEDFLSRWGVLHRLSSAYNPQSNGRAELAVKSTKRLLLGNVDTDGFLDTENFLHTRSAHEIIPSRDCIREEVMRYPP